MRSSARATPFARARPRSTPPVTRCWPAVRRFLFDLARAGFGRARHFFYDAVRSASSRARVLELQPLAEELDRLDHGDELQKYVVQIAAADFTVRAPLAALYQSLAVGKGPSDDAGQLALFDRFRRAHQPDLLFGALSLTGQAAHDTAELRQLAKASGDRDLIGIAEYYFAGLQTEHDNVVAAVNTLVKAVADCDRGGVQLRCSNNELILTTFLISMHRPAEARIYGLAAWNRARRVGDEDLKTEILAQLGEVHLLADRFALVRAYLDENELRQPDDALARVHAQETVAVAYVSELKPQAARAELAAIRKSGRDLDGNGIWATADLSHQGLTAEERAYAVDSVAKLRKLPGAGPDLQAMLDFLEGRLVVDVEPERGRKLLRGAIDSANKLPHDDADAQKARAFSYQTLIAATGSAKAWPEALALFAEEASLPLPGSCVVAVAVDNERNLAVVRDARGQIHGTLSSRSEPALDAAHFVPAGDVAALSACPSVTVLARPPLYGNPDLLPPSLAWSYRIGHPQTVATPGAARQLIVSDVEPPPALRLPKLVSWRGDSGVSSARVELKGAAATPDRVLAEVADATEVVFNAHGLVDSGQSDATMLVLSPDADGRYTLSVADLRNAHLRRAPLVILAACRAGELIVPSPHDPISLPSAFLRAGARAVLASSAPILDADAATFFDGVRARATSGSPFPAALRDERQAWLSRDGSSWVRQVMLFE